MNLRSPNTLPIPQINGYSQQDTSIIDDITDLNINDFQDFVQSIIDSPIFDDSIPSSPEIANQPQTIRFDSLHDLRRFMEKTNLNLDDYQIIMPAKKFRSIRYDKRPKHENKCEFILQKSNK